MTAAELDSSCRSSLAFLIYCRNTMKNSYHSQRSCQGNTTGDSFDSFRRWHGQPKAKAKPKAIEIRETTPYYLKGIRPETPIHSIYNMRRRHRITFDGETLGLIVSIPLGVALFSWCEYPTTTTYFFLWIFSFLKTTWAGLLVASVLFAGTWLTLSINPTDRYCHR